MIHQFNRELAVDSRFANNAAEHEQSWAHASGWAQLSGRQQTVTCVLSCENQAHSLSKLLPILSDTLTECGYPWELVLIDRHSSDGTDSLMNAWTALPGFRVLKLESPGLDETGFASGLLTARGDAIILINADLPHSPELIPQMILWWEADALLVHARHNPTSGKSELVRWDLAETHRHTGRPDFSLPPECTQLGLLDRGLVNWLKDAH